MPRDGSGIYSRPLGTNGVPDTTIESTKYNAFVADVETDLNAPRPVIAGGTGSTSPAGARDNIDAERAMQEVTNYATHVFEPGSFWSRPEATGGPIDGHLFVGTCIGASTGGQISLQAYDTGYLGLGVVPPVISPPPVYTKMFNGTTWGPWTPNFTIAGNAPQIILDRLDAQATSILGARGGKLRWLVQPGDGKVESGSNVGSDLIVGRYNDAGIFLDTPLSITRSTGIVTMEVAKVIHSKGTDWGNQAIRFWLSGANLTWDVNLAGSFKTLFDTGNCSVSATSNGYQKLASGIIFQWGFIGSSSGEATVSFPVAFPAGVLGAVTSMNAAIPSSSLLSVNVSAVTTTQISLQARYANNGGVVGAATQGINWFAIGC